jgi:hypothetical protein
MDLNKLNIDDICIKIYDPSKQQLLGTYNGYKAAAKVLGLSYRTVYTACANKTRRFSPFLKIEVAIRAAGIKKENNENSSLS